MNNISDAIRLLRACVLVALVLGVANPGYARAEDQRKPAEPRAGAAKAGEARTAQATVRPKVATQKLMRYPWEKKSVVARSR